MGVELNTHDIPDLVLSDTFHEWFTVTNNSIIDKLNRLMIYDVATSGGSAGDGISAGYNTAGLLHIEIGSTIEKDITFNGNITVNGSTTTINSTEFTVDDFNLILGHTGTGFSANDEFIMNNSGNSAGGGIIVNGASGDKEFLWKYPNAAWNSNQNIALASGKSLLDEVRIATGASGGNATKGLIFGFTAGTTGGLTGSNSVIQAFNSEIGTGHTADAMYINDDGYVSIVNGANKITVDQSSHGFSFGMPVYMKSDGDYAKATAVSRAEAEVVGVVSRYYDDNKFEITLAGEIIGNFSDITDESSTLSPGNAYFLSTTSGQVTASKPESTNQIQKTVLIALGSDRAIVKNYIGGEVNIIQDAAASLKSNRIIVLQEGHGLTWGDAVRIGSINDGSTEAGKIKRCDTTPEGSDVVGIIDNIGIGGITAAVSVVMSGKFEIAGGNVPTDTNAGEVFYLNPTTVDPAVSANIISGADPAFAVGLGGVNKPVFVSDGISGGIITNWRGIQEGGEVEDFISDVPVGAIMAWSGEISAIPDGFVLCDGTVLDGTNSDYEDLWQAIGSKYGGTQSSFQVPDLRGRFVVGYNPDDNDFDELSISGVGGSKTHQLTIDEMPSHNHPQTEENQRQPDNDDFNHANPELKDYYWTGDRGNPNAGRETFIGVDGGGYEFTTSAGVKPQGGGAAHENLPPYFTLAYIIRARGLGSLPDGTQILGGDTEYISITNYDIGGGELLAQNPDSTYDPLGWIRLGENVNGGLGGGFGDPYRVHTVFVASMNEYFYNSETEVYSVGRSNAAESVWTIDIAAMQGNGYKPALARSFEVMTTFDDDYFLHYLEYFDENTGTYRLVNFNNNQHPNNQQNIQQGSGSSFTLPIATGQTQITFRSNIWLHTNPTGFANNQADSIGITIIGVNQVADNSLTRPRQSYTSRKNLVINGDFDLWQRAVGTASALTTAGDLYSADRWQRKENLTTGVRSIKREAFSFSQNAVPHYPQYYMDIQGYDNAGSPDANGYSYLIQKIEDARTLAAKNVTISFWAKGTVAGTALVSLERSYGSGLATDYQQVNTIAVAQDQWKRYTVTTRVRDLPNSVSSEGLDSNGFPDSYMGVAIATYAKAGQLGTDSAGTDIKYTGTLSIAQVQVEEGSRATEFEIIDSGTELALAQRYYNKSLAPHLAPTTSDFPSKVSFTELSINNTASVDIDFPVHMRTFPGCSIYGLAGTENTIRLTQFSTTFSNGDLSSGTATDIAVTSKLSSQRGIHSITIEDDGNAHFYVTAHCNYTADAEL